MDVTFKDKNANPVCDSKQVVAVIADLIIFCRQARAYPENHPVVNIAAERLLQRLGALPAACSQFTIGVTRRHLLFNDHPIEQHSLTFSQFAATLAEHGIVTFTIEQGLTPVQLHRFNRLIGTPRDDVWEAGGIEQALNDAAITHIKVQGIDPSQFVLKDRDEASPEAEGPGNKPGLWERLAQSLLAGTFLTSGDKLLQMLASSPQELAGEFAASLGGLSEEAKKERLRMAAAMIAEIERSGELSTIGEELLDNIATFFSALTPELRHAFLSQVFGGSAEGGKVAEQVLPRIPAKLILEALSEAASQEGYAPPVILRVLQTLAAKADPALAVAPIPEKGAEQLRVLFRKDEFEKYVPENYRRALYRILKENRLPPAEVDALEKSKETLQLHRVEMHTAEVIFEVLRTLPPEDAGSGFQENLRELAGYFLDSSDFRSLIRLGEGMAKSFGALPEGIMQLFAAPEFVERALAGAASLERESYPDFQAFLVKAGLPFVNPLLERLAVEENRSLRRLFLECLREIGPPARDAALARLGDSRWFFVRNLLDLLRGFNEPEVLRKIRRLNLHPHPKIRAEVLKTLIGFQDPSADKMLLQDLGSSDPARQMNAVQLAENSRNPQVIDRLLGLLGDSKLNDQAFELKKAVVRTLAAIGDNRAFPALEQLLHSRSIFHPVLHKKLKLDVIRSLDRYPAETVRPLLSEFAASSQKELAAQAGETLRSISGRKP